MASSDGAMLIGTAVPSLARWGCSPDADLVYRLLVTFGPRTGRALKQNLGISSARIDRAVDELASYDAVEPRRGVRGADFLWAARPSPEVVERLRHRHRLRHRPRREHSVATTTATAVTIPTPVPLGHGLRHLPTRALARQRMSDLVKVATREHLSMHPEHAFAAESVRAAQPLDRALITRGVPMRVLGVAPPGGGPAASPAGSGVLPRYRQATSVPMKLIVLDRKVAFFPVDPGDLERGYLEVAQAPVVSALVALFEQHWERGWDAWEDAVPEVTLSDRERALIVLLAEGYTDVTAAQELGISARSVTNILRNLMDRFQVDNRFQLGLALGALRVVPPPGPTPLAIDGERDAKGS